MKILRGEGGSIGSMGVGGALAPPAPTLDPPLITATTAVIFLPVLVVIRGKAVACGGHFSCHGAVALPNVRRD